jgi:hypothetical protein
MSHSSRRAIAGIAAASERASQICAECIRRLDECETEGELKLVFDWAKSRGGLFLRSGEDDRRLRDAYDRAKARIRAVASGHRPVQQGMAEA